jgi:hypothetical protein
MRADLAWSDQPVDRLVNLTPHAVALVLAEGEGEPVTLVIPPSGQVARCAEMASRVGTVCHRESATIRGGIDVPVVKMIYGEITGLPEPQPGRYYIVSRLVAEAAAALGRRDCLVPAQTVRDGQGRITGCRALALV